MRLAVLLRLLGVLLLLAPLPALACEGAEACALGDRSYHVRLPDGWDGATPMPVMVHFHGWGRQGDLIVNHQRISGHTRRRGVLLVAPNGEGRTWNFWRPGGDDVPFVQDVLADVAHKYPVAEGQLYVSGYSYGAAMAWRFACEAEVKIIALLAISGGLRPTEPCPNAPGEVRQVWGFADTVLRFPFGPDNDETQAVALWRQVMGCNFGARKPSWQAVSWLSLDRWQWDCAQGRVMLDTHTGGHFIPHGWLGWQLDQIMGRTPRYP